MNLESTDLSRLEEIIQRNIGSFYEVGHALMEIRDRGLYKLKNGGSYDTFEAYCKGEWDFNASRARQLIGAALTMDNIKALPVVTVLPIAERQARPLARLAPEKQREVWKEVVETAPEGRVTAALVSKIVIKTIRGEIENKAVKTKADVKRIRKEDIVSEEFRVAYEAFYRQVQSAKLEKWKDTSKEACVQMLKWINDLIAL